MTELQLNRSSLLDESIGVIGGIGPEATFQFCSAVVKHTKARVGSDHIRQLVDCNPKLPDVNSSVLGTGPSVESALRAAAIGLEQAGADFLVMICNAAHFYEATLREAIRIPFVSLIEVAVQAVASTVPRGCAVGVLATDGCIASQVYTKALQARELREIPIDEEHMSAFLSVLSDVRRNAVSADSIDRMSAITQSLIDEGARCLIAGCTEAVCVLERLDIDTPIVDPVDELAKKVVDLVRPKHRRSSPIQLQSTDE